MIASNCTMIYRFMLVIFSLSLNIEEQKCNTPEQQKDSTEIKNIIIEARQTAITNLPQALKDLQKAIDLAFELNDNKLLFIAYRTKGSINEENNRLTDAYSCYEKALALQDFLPINKKLDIYLDWAIINKKLAKYEVTRDYYQRTLDLANKVNDQEMIEFVYSGLGTLNGALGVFDKAIEYHLLSKEIAEKRNNIEGVISAYVNISTVYTQSKNYKFAYNSLEKCYELAFDNNDSMRIAYISKVYSKALSAEKKYKEAILYLQKALKYSEPLQDKDMNAQILGLMAHVYTQMEQYEEAEITFKKCFEYSSYFDFYEQPNLYLSLGSFYLKTKRPAEAEIALSKSLELATNRGFIDLIQKTNRSLVDVYQQLGDSKQALKHLKIAKIYEDSIFNGDKIKRIAEAQYKFDMNKTETEHKLSLAKSEKEIQELYLRQNRLILLCVSILSCAVLLFAFFYIKQKNKNNQVLSQKSIEILLKNSRLEKSNEVLQQFAYASAHDLKEPLRSISGFVSIINRRYTQLLPPESSGYMNFVVVGVKRMECLIGALLEYSTLASDEEDSKHSTHLSHILNDVQGNLHSVILEKNAVIEHAGYLPALKISRLHLTQLLQNLIGNAVKFSDKKPLIQVSGKIEDGQYILEIQDNGIGMKEEYSDKIFRLFQRLSRSAEYDGTGIGLAICKQIVDKYESTIRFNSVENVGTTFILSFPTKLVEMNNTIDFNSKLNYTKLSY